MERQQAAPPKGQGKRTYLTNAARQAAFRARKAGEDAKREAERQRFADWGLMAEAVCVKAARLCHAAGLPAATLEEIAASLDHLRGRFNRTKSG